MKRICPKCKILKPLNDFGIHKSSHTGNGHSYTCKSCNAIYVKNRRIKFKEKYKIQQLRFQNSPKGIYKILKRKIKFYGKKSFNLEQDDFIKWYDNIPKTCHYCDVSEEKWKILNNPYSKRYKRLTIDRLNSKIGYQINNIVLACFRCNIIKSDLLSAKEMKEIAQKYIKPKWHLE